jgi:hypothetical protein
VGRKIREIELKENGLLVRLVLQLGDRLDRLLGTAHREVSLRAVRKEMLKFDLERWVKGVCAPITLVYGYRSNASVTTYEQNHVEHTGTHAYIYFGELTCGEDHCTGKVWAI